MRKFRLRLFALVSALVVGATAAEAQVFTPTYMGPSGGGRFGIFIADFGDLAVEGALRTASSGWNLEVRGGLLDADDLYGMAGVQAQLPLILGTEPLQTAFTLGGQGIFGDETAFGGQAGFNLGANFPADAIIISPYIHPRVALIDFGGNSDAELELLADLGLNIAFRSRLTLHIGASLNDDVSADWGIGFSFR